MNQSPPPPASATRRTRSGVQVEPLGAPVPVPQTPANSSLEKFLHEFSVASDSAVGVFAIRTREPHRVEAALRKWAFIKTCPFRTWDCLAGWTLVPAASDEKKHIDPVKDPVMAMRWLGDLDNDGKACDTRNGVFIFNWPHFYLGGPGRQPNPVMLACIRHYSREFTCKPVRRLILLMPEGAVLPAEVEHDVRVIDLDLPTETELTERFVSLSTQRRKLPGGAIETITLNFNATQVQRFVNIGAGMAEAQFEAAVSQAIVENRDQFPNIPEEKFAHALHQTKVQVIKESKVLELIEANTSMADVGGMAALKRWLRKRKPCLTPEGIADGLDSVLGLVALGPPGTGKSLVARATATELNLPLIRFNMGAVFGSLVGESEKNLRNTFTMLKAIGKAVVWLDEVEKAVPKGGSGGGDSGVSQRVLGSLLTFMDDNKTNLFWVATGNWPNMVDPAFARKGRFDEVFAVLPPNELERLEILQIHLRKRGQRTDIPGLEEAVRVSDGFVPAEIEAAIKEAILENWGTDRALDGFQIAKQFGDFKRLSIAFAEQFQYMEQWAANNARAASDPMPSHVPAARTREDTGGDRDLSI